MQVFRKLDDLPSDLGPTLLSVGNFDGVHLAHQHVLCHMTERARERRLVSMAVTFDPHPVRILRPDLAPRLLTPLSAKLRLLEAEGLDAVLVIPFTRDLSLTPPQDFAEHVLGRQLRAMEVHEGANFHFGHRAEGNVERLAEFGRAFGFEVFIYPEMRLRGEPVSSSRIRELLGEGRVSRARHLLGRPFSVLAAVGRGRGFGQKFTVPTINLGRYDEMTPANGVYITRTRLAEDCYDSVTNVGVRPTFGGESFAIESHLLDFHPVEVPGDAEVEISFLHWLRPEIKFPAVEALRKQIARDAARARRFFSCLKPASKMS